ncbi:hypothetical protein HS048_23210 [Planomonospora sp. ID91781]|uniref:hypothetical protein n=1 Tax=Planomonospora sp. ID91781 TaxID=2738135 RepID=UPI0018C36048|nr:hypothetical protein [Planomonospora sp. ID91781]MBG0823632.1 hypothetical protein [Planomonospora sp. ID91781]
MDHEHAVGTARGDFDLLVSYRVKDGVIDRVIFMTLAALSGSRRMSGRARKPSSMSAR